MLYDIFVISPALLRFVVNIHMRMSDDLRINLRVIVKEELQMMSHNLHFICKSKSYLLGTNIRTEDPKLFSRRQVQTSRKR